MEIENQKYKFTTKDVIANLMIMAVYVVLTMVTYPVSFLVVQFRIAEIMVLLVFFRKDYAFDLILGCAVACIFPVLFNSFIVGFELYQFLGFPFWLSTAQVAIGETAVMIVGYIFFMCIKRRKTFFTTIRTNQNIEFKW